MTPRANAAKMLASGRRNADRFHGELFAIYVMQENLTDEDRMALERNVTLARAQHAQVEIAGRQGSDRGRFSTTPASHGITQIFVGHNLRADWRIAPRRHAARPAHPRRRRHGRARLSAVIGTSARRRGRLKVFLGYAAGVGKTYQMLTEAHELKRPRRRRRHRVLRAARADGNDRAQRRTRNDSAKDRRVPRITLRGNGHRRDPAPASCKSPSSTSFRTPTCPARRG